MTMCLEGIHITWNGLAHIKCGRCFFNSIVCVVDFAILQATPRINRRVGHSGIGIKVLRSRQQRLCLAVWKSVASNFWALLAQLVGEEPRKEKGWV